MMSPLGEYDASAIIIHTSPQPRNGEAPCAVRTSPVSLTAQALRGSPQPNIPKGLAAAFSPMPSRTKSRKAPTPGTTDDAPRSSVEQEIVGTKTKTYTASHLRALEDYIFEGLAVAP